MEVLVEDILNKLYLKNFAESEQPTTELEKLILRDNMMESEIAFCSSKIFNSEVNIFKFLEESAYEKDRLFANLRKNLFKLIGNYIVFHKKHVFEYLPLIKETTMKVYNLLIYLFLQALQEGNFKFRKALMPWSDLWNSQ